MVSDYSRDGQSDIELLQRLLDVGFAKLPGARIPELVRDLENRAVDSGLAAPVFVAEALGFVEALFGEHDRGGGVSPDFLAQLDRIVRESIPRIQKGDPVEATGRSKLLRDELGELVASYDWRKDYEQE